MIIKHNMPAMNANRTFNLTGKSQAKSIEKLSSGYKINRSADESAIRDTDIGTEMVTFSNNNILLQAGQSVLVQANQSKQGALALLQ